MDYDDKEFQGQNCHIDGEGSSKFSPVSHPYALPKFDFDDDGLQGHLRFDNLVENEAFLAIPSQEDNQWIEDFSRGSGDLVFSSSAPEPCPTLRSNNVWSEATSSESVEMLLKSVGQEETVAVVEDLDAGKKLGSVVEQMESRFKEDDKTMNVMGSDLTLLSEKVADHNAVLNDVTSVSNSTRVGISTDVGSHMLSPNALSETCGVDGDDNNLDSKLGEKNLIEVDTSLKKSCVSGMQSPSTSNLLTEVEGSISQDIIVNTVSLDNQKSTTMVPDVGSDSASCLLTVTVKEVKEKDVSSKEVQVDDRNFKGIGFGAANESLENLPCSSSKSGSVELCAAEISVNKLKEPSSFTVIRSSDIRIAEELCAAEINVNKLDEPSNFTVIGSSDIQMAEDLSAAEINVNKLDEPSNTVIGSSDIQMAEELSVAEIDVNKLDEPCSFTVTGSGDIQMAEVCEEDAFNSESNKGSGRELINSSNMAQIHQQIDENIQDNSAKDFPGGGNLVAHVIEVSTKKAEAEVVHSSVEGEVLLQGSDHQLITEVSISNNKATSLSKLGNYVSDSQGDRTSTSFVVEHSSVTSTCFATSIQEKDHPVEISKFGNVASGVHKISSAEDFVSSPTVSALASNLNIGSHDQVVSSNGEEKPMFPSDSSGMEYEIIEPCNNEKGVGISSLGESSKLNNEAVSDSERDSAARIEPDVTADMPYFLNETNAADQTRENTKIEKAGSVEANLMPLEETLRSKDNLELVLEFDKGSASKLTEELSQEGGDHSLPVVGTSNTANESEQIRVSSSLVSGIPNSGVQAKQAEKPHQISESSSRNLDLFPSTCDPVSKQNRVDDESATPANHGAIGKDHTLASSVNSDSDVPTPSISSCNVLDKSEGEKENPVEKSLVTSVPPAGSVDLAFEDGKLSDIAKDGKRFTFEVNLSSGVVREGGQDKQCFPTTQSFSSFKEASPSTPSIGTMEPKTVLDPSRVSSQAPDPKLRHAGSTGTPVRKRGRPSGKTPKTVLEPSRVSSQVLDLEISKGGSTGTPVRKRGRPSGAKNKSSLKETATSIQSKRGDNKSSVSTSLTGTGKLQFEEVKLHEKAKHSAIVSHAGVSVATPNLPDLNTSASPSALVVRQPFSDIQQMQLRAQIFVYGSLIQGAAPDETCMVAAFGTSDGGRNMWESVWRACVEKLQGVKSNPGKSENPLQPQSGSNPPERSSFKKDALQSSMLLPTDSRASFKGTPSPVVNPMIPLSSPLWNVSSPFQGLLSPGMPRSSVFDYRQTQSPSHPFQTPPSRNISVNNSPWPSHTSFPAPWITASQSSPFVPSARLPTSETLKSTPIKEPVSSLASGAKHSSPSATVHYSSPSVSVEPNPLPVMKKTSVPSGQKTVEPKTRKRKKSSALDNLIAIPLLSQGRTESVPAPVPLLSQGRTESVPSPVPLLTQARIEPVPALVVPSHLSTSVVVSTPPFFGSKGNDAKIVTTASLTYLADQPKSVEPNIEQMPLVPEDALIKDEAEAKKQAEDAAKSAAASVSHCQTVWDQLNKQINSGLKPEVEANLASAAVAVAAAADVAKAAAAAAHAASIAASQTKKMFDSALSISHNSIGLATTSSIFNGNEGNSSSSILVAAKEAARKKVESASFASKLAENLDAVLKAAELAAAAASQVGRIVAMGDPPSLAKLVEAGPEGYWRTPQVNEERSNVGIIQESPNVSGDKPTKKKAKSTSRGMFNPSREGFKDSMEDHTKEVEGMPTFFPSSEKDLRARRGSRALDLDKTIGVVPESESGSRPTYITAQYDDNKSMGTLKGTSIKEGCLVEVKKEGNGFKEAWFSAHVLSLENGKAFLSYTGSKSGSSELKEWVSLEGDGDNEPRLRIARADKQFDGTKKRRRGAVGDCLWSVGDKVDVWMRECWREGVVTDKNVIDSTTLTVHFPAEGETSLVREWLLRPTLIWKDGEWMESSSSRQKDPFYKGDTPQGKRLKLGGPSMEGSKKNISRTFQLPEPERPEELQLLPLSDKEKMFNIGNDNKKDNKRDAPRTVRSGLQKEGPRVVFGVPKPGKKKKFMEVSKHFVAESSNKTDKSREKYMMPRDDTKVKQQGELKTRIPKPGKTISSFGRTLPKKDKFPSSSIPTKYEAKKSTSTDGSEPEQQQKRSEFRTVSSTDKAAQGSFAFSSSALSRNMFTSNTRSERAKRGNRAPVAGKWVKGEAKVNIDSEKQVAEVSEPRRSNRRIQPTSRLLEGLQSSLSLPKFPSFAHDKGQRSHSSTPKGTVALYRKKNGK